MLNKGFKYLFFLALLILIFSNNGNSQHKYHPLNNQTNLKIQHELSKIDNSAHASMRPYLESDIEMTQANKVFIDSGKYYSKQAYLLFKSDLLKVKDTNFFVSLNPLFNFQFSQDINDDVPFRRTNTRGGIVRGDIGKTLSFSTAFYENQVRLPDYTERITSRGIVPGQARYKRNGAIYDYAYSSAYVSFSPNQNLNFQIGHDKQFVGNGYRSMLLSDNTFNQLFAKMSFYFGKRKFKYSTWISQLQTLDRIRVKSTPEAYFKPKAAAFNYLSFKPNNRLELGLFESTIYKIYDDTLGNQPIHYSAYLPIIMSRTAVNGLSGSPNAMLGLNASFKLSNKAQIYAQYAVDDISTHKQGLQLGVKVFDLFKKENLYAQFEYNKANKNLYAANDPMLNYSHYAQEFAHPLGAWFDELLMITYYEKQKFFVQGKIISAFQKQIGEEFYGANIFESDITELEEDIGEKMTTLNLQDIQIGYKLNVKTNMQFLLGFTNRIFNPIGDFQHDMFLYVGFRTNWNNIYLDF